MLTLAIGDLFIPDRSISIPAKFIKLLCPNPTSRPTNSKIGQVICLGNITNSLETVKFLNDLSPSFHIVRGEFDEVQVLSQQVSTLVQGEAGVPLFDVVEQDNLKIGFTNGYQLIPKGDPLALLVLARELDVDILIWGGTHKVEAYTLDGKFFINPGSATGAFSFDWPDESGDGEDEVDEEDSRGEFKDESKEHTSSSSKLEELDAGTRESNQNSSSENGNNNPKEASNKKDLGTDDKTMKDPLEDVATNDRIKDEIEESVTPIPSFCLLDTHGSTCTLYIYTYFNGEIKVDKVSYQKE